jgi:hypothetical protein
MSVDLAVLGAGRWAYVEVRRIVAEATYEHIPIIEPMNKVDESGIDLTSEVGKIGGQTADHKEAQEWFRDGLAEAPQFCG